MTLRGTGKGGRNSEFALSMAIDLNGLEGVHVLAADTDGIDGSEDNAGAFADGGSVARLALKGLDASVLLANNDAWSAFEAIGDLFLTGPTGTNVNDFRAILVQDYSRKNVLEVGPRPDRCRNEWNHAAIGLSSTERRACHGVVFRRSSWKDRTAPAGDK